MKLSVRVSSGGHNRNDEISISVEIARGVGSMRRVISSELSYGIVAARCEICAEYWRVELIRGHCGSMKMLRKKYLL
jgi:hypothetical protein